MKCRVTMKDLEEHTTKLIQAAEREIRLQKLKVQAQIEQSAAIKEIMSKYSN